MRKRTPSERLRVVVGAIAALALVTVGSAFAAYVATTAHTTKIAPEARELSGLVSSPTYPNWYWAQSDVWKATDDFSACSGLLASELSRCQQVQRTRLWALRLDPVTHQVLEARGFALSDPQWALDPHLAQNNDWEDLAVGPERTAADGTATRNLIVAATGNAAQNRVRDADGRDITCDTRRLIELPEPDLSDPQAATWTPWKLYDIRSYVGTNKISDCNAESLVVAQDASGTPQAYMVTRTGQAILSRSLDVTTGRDPGQAYVPPGTGTPYDPTVTYLGVVKNATGMTISGADSNGSDVVLSVPQVGTKPCRVLTWQPGSVGVAETLRAVAPTVTRVSCTRAEGVTYARDSTNPSVPTRDLVIVADSNTTTVRYWYLPWAG